MELSYGAVDGVVVECGPAEKLPDGTVTGDLGVLSVVFAGDDCDALDVGVGALALTVGIAGEAARGETAGALAASAA
jgi:hypothetical protein